MARSTHLRTLLSDARREQVLDAATKVFAEQGFHKSTIKKIAGEAGIADGTIYNYFTNKTDLLLGLLDRMNETDQRSGDLGGLEEGDFEAFFKVYLRHRMEVLRDNLELLRAVLPELLVNEPLRKRYFDTVLAPTYALAQDHFKMLEQVGAIKPLGTELLTRVIPGTLLGLAVLSMLGDETVVQEWNQLPDLISELVLHGVTANSTSAK